jgi:membrane protein implicated in regulation of membrane protease activity
MLIFLLILLLIAAALGVLGAVIKATLIIVLSLILAFTILCIVAWFVLKNRINKYAAGYHDARQKMGTSTIEVRGTVHDDSGDEGPKSLPD